MSRFTRAFARRGTAADRVDLPPGQYDAEDRWPVLSAEATPKMLVGDWTFGIEGLVENPVSWSWDDAQRLPPSTYRGAIHCVTAWSKFDMEFTGVSVDTLLAIARPKPEATHVVATSSTGYTTNLPLADVINGQAWIVWAVNGSPLTAEHGGPVRMIVPHLYFWKSAKWIASLRVLDHDEPGFWEQHGYHNHGDPWREERYRGD